MRLHRAVPTAVLVLLLTAGVAAADGGHGQERSRAPFTGVHGFGDFLLGQWWARVLAIPAPENPLSDPDAAPICLRLGPHDTVLAPVVENKPVTCTMSVDTKLFLALPGAECSSNEPPPSFAATAPEQRDCATGFAFAPGLLTYINLSLDDGPPQNVLDPRFRDVSPQFRTVFPQTPIDDATPGPATFVAAGYDATFARPLRPGRHTVDVEVGITDSEPVEVSIVLDVVSR